MLKILIAFAISIFIASCSSQKSTERLIIASEQADCVGVAPMKCLLIKKGGQNDWEYLYEGIQGFNYVPGYEYIVEVKTETRENPAADQSSIAYILVKEVSKEQKTSDNLPR